MNFLIRKLFYNFCWGIAWRKLSSSGDSLPVNELTATYTHIPISRRHYYADPFIVCYNNAYYLFAEHMLRSRGIASIAVSKFNGHSFGKWKDVIVEDFHMSYPNVFSYGNAMYMLPETSGTRKLILYRATEFPYRWEMDSILLDDVSLVDTSVFRGELDREVLLFSHDISSNQLRVFSLDLEEKKLVEIDKTTYSAVDDRPGGNPITINGHQFRPLQDCSMRYGEKLLIYRSLNNSSQIYAEEFYGTIQAKNTALDYDVSIDCVHTINRCNLLEVIDYQYQRFYWNKPFVRIARRLRIGKK